MAKLVVRKGSHVGTEFPADRLVLRLGRGSGSDVLLEDSQVSRRHAEISQQGDQAVIRDLGSTNGTFVNDERVIDVRVLKPGDEIRIGDTILGYESGVATTAASPVTTGREADVWSDRGAAGYPGGRSRALVWGLGGVIAVLLVALGVVLVLMLNKPETPAPLALEPQGSSAPAIVVAPSSTATPESATVSVVQPTDTPLVDLPTVELEATVPASEPPATKPPVVPSPLPPGPEALEELPAIIAQAFPGVPADQLPQAIAEQMQSLTPEQLQEIIGALFPGVDPAQLPQVVAASFPEIPLPEIERLLQGIFGQSFEIPEMGPVGGRLVLGIYDQGKDQHDLYLIDALGGQPTLLREQGSEPDFSPDREWVVYSSWASDRLGLRLMKTDGSGDTELTAVKEHGYPTFSPDGTRISFYNSAQKILQTINRDGSGMRDIGQGEYPAWSPAGDQIVYRGCVGGGKCGLIVANADGSNPRQITTHANDAAPRWSPNGGQIAFHSDRDGNWEIYVINVDGSWLRRITIDPATDVMPVWSPDGLRIAFRSDRGGKGAVWLTSGIGGPATKLLDANFDPASPEQAQMDWGK